MPLTLVVLLMLSALVAFVLAVLVLQGERHKAERMTFALFSGSMGAWAFFVGLFLMTDNAAVAKWSVTLYYIFAVVLVYGLLAFSLAYSAKQRTHARQAALYSLLSLPAAGLILGVVTPNALITSVGVTDGRVVGLNESLYIIYCLVFAAYACMALRYLLMSMKTQGAQGQHIRMIIAVICICLPIASYFNLILPLLGSYSYIGVGPVFVLPVALVFFYAIVRHSLFDIRLAIVRSVAYSFIMVSLITAYFGLALLVSTMVQGEFLDSTQLVISFGLALLLTLVFQPIKQFFDRSTNRVFYRSDYDSDEFYSRLNQKLSTPSDLREMLESASSEIGQTLHAEQSFFFVWYGEDQHMTAGSKRHDRMTLSEVRALDSYVIEQGDATIITALTLETHAVSRILTKHKIAITLPLIFNGRVLGYAFLGDRHTGNYSRRDIRVLETVADTLLIAIQNALSVQEVKELNATLQQRIDDATKELRASNAQLQKLDEAKDEFVSMASHQLRTPLTSVKGYLSMVLEGDAGKISDAQHHLLSEAFTSSERMVHLINDFLNVSRLQTGKFMVDRRAIDLAKITHQEVDSLKTTAGARNLKLKYRKPSYFPTLYIDEGKIRQVIMNFIDNAIYYSSEFSTITINLEVEDGDAILTVHNDGIGVPESEKSHLFTKFFRAANARKQRPDGTGVGLFLSKMVVTAHGGKMVFESQPNEGTTFGFRLPIKKLSTPPAETTD
ncbi:MAG: Sensor protein resE [Candidatus Saccharibacteria bacterium]|nr:Sensor protein resE [Candidatus Saccharibacteria bacterium]